ncbi:hypothetical protein CcaCcLH18_10536 [Colletotrichum camelliae]|nr:hypothetical protein CcaCcLH18_10536 [Colletotrichum camelliae]
MAPDGGRVDVAEPYQAYKTSTNYFLQWLWIEYKLRAPQAAKANKFKSTNDILRAAKILAATAASVPSTVIQSLHNAINKRQEVLKIYQDLGSDDAAHEAFLHRLEETLKVLDPLVPKPSTPRADTPELESFVATNRFSALGIQEPTELSSIDTFLPDTQKQHPEAPEDEPAVPASVDGDIVLEDDSIMIKYEAMCEGIRFFCVFYRFRTRVEQYWTDVAEEKMPFALASWLTSAAMSFIQSGTPSTLATSINLITGNEDLVMAICSQSKMVQEVSTSAMLSEVLRFGNSMTLVAKQAGHIPKNSKLRFSKAFLEELSEKGLNISACKDYLIGPKNVRPWGDTETYAFVIPEILNNIEQVLHGKRSIEKLEKGFLPDISPALLEVLEQSCSGQISKRACLTRLPAIDPDHKMTPKNQQFLETSVKRASTSEPLIVPARQAIRNREMISYSTLSAGLHILVSSSKAFFWPRGVKQKEWNCGLRPLRLAMDMKKKLVTVTPVVKRFVDNGKAKKRSLKLAEDTHRALDEYTKGVRWDLYHQAPWTAGCHLNELLFGAMILGHVLYSDLPAIPAVLHLYNALCMSDIELTKIEVLEGLCEYFKEYAFNGKRPKTNFFTHSRCSLYYDWKKPVSSVNQLVRRPYLRESVYLNQHPSDHIINYEIVARLHNINAELPFNEAMEAKLRSLHKGMDPESYLEKAERMAKKDFEEHNPVANFNYFEAFNLCGKVLDTFGIALYEPLKDHPSIANDLVNGNSVVQGSSMVDEVLKSVDESRNKGRSARKNLRNHPLLREAIRAFDSVDKNTVFQDLCWEV